MKTQHKINFQTATDTVVLKQRTNEFKWSALVRFKHCAHCGLGVWTRVPMSQVLRQRQLTTAWRPSRGADGRSFALADPVYVPGDAWTRSSEAHLSSAESEAVSARVNRVAPVSMKRTRT